MRFACRIKKATNTHSYYATINSFPRNNGYETIYVYTYIACFFSYFNQNWNVPINFKYTSKYQMKLHELSFSILQTNGQTEERRNFNRRSTRMETCLEKRLKTEGQKNWITVLFLVVCRPYADCKIMMSPYRNK